MHKVVAVFSWAALSVCLQAAQLPVIMGPTVSTFTVLGSAAVSTSSTTNTVNGGNVGVCPGTSAGFLPAQVTGTIYTGTTGPACTAEGELTTAYNDAAGRTSVPSAVGNVAGNLDGQTLTPGLYNSSSTLGLGVGQVLYLNGAANSVFIFQVGSALNMSSGSRVVLEAA